MQWQPEHTADVDPDQEALFLHSYVHAEESSEDPFEGPSRVDHRRCERHRPRIGDAVRCRGHAAAVEGEGGHRLVATDLYSAIPELAEIIRGMRMLVLSAPDDDTFLTSDAPLVLRSRATGSPIVGGGWSNRYVQATMPLHPSRYLYLSHTDPVGIELAEASHEQMRDLNFATLMFADTEIYSLCEDQEALNWLLGRDQWLVT